MNQPEKTKKTSVITSADFVGAGIVYFAIALEVFIGDLPSKGSGPHSAGFYEKNVILFWSLVSFEAAFGLFYFVRGIITRWQQRSLENDVLLQGRSGVDRVINAIAASLIIFAAFCYMILPIIETYKGTAYGGEIFKNHLLSVEPTLFWELVCFHFVVAAAGGLGGVLLLLFPPRKAVEAFKQKEFQMIDPKQGDQL